MKELMNELRKIDWYVFTVGLLVGLCISLIFANCQLNRKASLPKKITKGIEKIKQGN